ncbi:MULTISPECIES: hypothetical protein [unclassified Polaromonas]|jgi:hypothetical protein|uniref:hypothetical protein n=1 Tax=unclassified Polaromonas TaxID=2638319 RepID=UPI000BC727D2|nr:MULTISPECIES: hypothetical protein [unclassified Polaromonas]OYY37065.1 MAG: hypothetical protein B7Y60_08825 [Polaromonas sp. 35-63-35]OYZ13601.1 MAG: hypothetical protein B7Y28_23510 [Polaromonas sp. 16-63-31]OYZ78822.1 MAG: hypothetical protein B7Y09_11090 [Polaromonas sp. 24-63-21]OZA49664.1 MAG: hypothetical protein B7X88_14740 [Polaromonas sp. 17-63-33]OZA86792.1 MAG: hypothetical protein B7X65_15080 [Polaromonas sp. 39-63-25]
MPIKPENRARYPADWTEIRAAILLRAGNRCEWPGCCAVNHAVGYWEGPNFTQICMKDEAASMDVEAADLADGFKVIEIVLTIAHRDHIPEHCDPANLAAWCQRHHLAYDQDHHTINAYMTRKAKANNLELPL